MRRWSGLALLALVPACSNLDEGEAGVVALEITSPSELTLEVGQQLQLSAVPLDADGQVVEAPVTWESDAPAVLAVDQSGVLTAVTPGVARVQAESGTLTSDFLSFTINARPDTLLIVGDSIIPVPVEPGASGALVVQLRSFNPADPLASRPVIYEIAAPAAGDAPVVALTGGVQSDTVLTGPDGTVTSVALSRVAGTVPPDTAIVAVRANRAGDTPVPGSGQRFIILFQ